jgi:peroxisomal 3,2-trans-enoyl-CoA isomerase
MSGKVLTAIRNNVFWITLNRPKVGNSLDPETYALLLAAIKAAAKDPTVKVAVVSGNGKFFSTGADVVGTLSTGAEAMVKTLQEGPVSCVQALIEFPKPIIAALNGPAVGWAAAFLGLFDVIYCAQSATLDAPFMRLGLVPEGLSSLTYPRTMGPSLAAEVLLLGRKLTANDMLQARFAARVFPDEGFQEAVQSQIEKAVADVPMNSLLGAKKLLRGHLIPEYLAGNKKEFEALVERFKSGEPSKRFQAIAAALAAKRKSNL